MALRGMAGRSTLEQFAARLGGLCEQRGDAHEAQDDDDPNNGGGDAQEVADQGRTTVTRYGTPGPRGGAPAVVSKRRARAHVRVEADGNDRPIRQRDSLRVRRLWRRVGRAPLAGAAAEPWATWATAILRPRLSDVGGLSLGGSARRVSDHRAGLEIRTTPWCVRIRVATCTSDGIVRPLCEYRLGYAEMHHTLPRRRYLADSCSAALTAAATSRFLTCSLAST
jgi:hypothetical protein